MSEFEIFAELGEENELTAAGDSGNASMLPSVGSMLPGGISSLRKPPGLRGVDASGRRLARINPTPIRENSVNPRRPRQRVNREIGRRGTLGEGNFNRRGVTPTPGAGPDIRNRRRAFGQPPERSVSTPAVPVVNFGPQPAQIPQETQIEGAGSLLGAELSPIAEGDIPLKDISPPSNFQAAEQVLPPVTAESPAQVPQATGEILSPVTAPTLPPTPDERPVRNIFSTSMPAAGVRDRMDPPEHELQQMASEVRNEQLQQMASDERATTSGSARVEAFRQNDRIINQMLPIQHQQLQMASDERTLATTTPGAAGIDSFRQTGPILTVENRPLTGRIQGRIQTLAGPSLEERRIMEQNTSPNASFFNSRNFPTPESATLNPANTPTPLRQNVGPTRDPSARPRAPLTGQQEEPAALRFGETPGGAALPTIEQQQAQVDAGGRIGRL